MDEMKIENAAIGIMLEIKCHNLTPMEEIAVLGKVTSSYARSIDAIYNIEKKSDEAIIKATLEALDKIIGSQE